MNHVADIAAEAEPSIAVAIRSLSVIRGNRTVLHGIDLSLPTGRLIGIIGPSGCGKSTLMRAIVGVQARVSGDIEVLGEPAGLASRRGAVGYLTQDPSVYDELSVGENLIYFGRLLEVGSKRIDDVLESVRLSDYRSQRVSDLSGGQRARVSLAIALLNEPPLLVLDEPTVGLDPVLRHELWAQFAELAAAGSTLLISSHVMDEATRCDWLILLRDGEVLANGSPGDLLARTGTDNVEDAFLALVAERGST
jgi:ABC-2 type transport system ATP-binding protein